MLLAKHFLIIKNLDAKFSFASNMHQPLLCTVHTLHASRVQQGFPRKKERTGFVEEGLSDFTGIAIGFVGSGKSANLFFPLFLLFIGAQVAISYVG